MSFAARLKSVRMRRGMSLQDLANAIGTSKGHLWDLESGNSKNPSIELLTKLSGSLKVTIGSLVGESSDAGENEQLNMMFRQLQSLDQPTIDLIQAMIDARLKQDRDKQNAD